MQDGQKDGIQQDEAGRVYRPGDSLGPSAPSTTSEPDPTEQPSAYQPQASVESSSLETQPSDEDIYTPPVFVAPANGFDDSQSVETSDELPHIEWTASEFVANAKTAGWFVVLALGSVVFAAVIYLLTEDIVPTAIIGLLGVIVGIAGARQPRVLNYSIDNTGLRIGDKFYPYATFKSFSVADDGAMGYISLLPLRRFMPPLTVHYDPNDEDKIAATLAEYLPYEKHKRDVVDSLTRKLRF